MAVTTHTFTAATGLTLYLAPSAAHESLVPMMEDPATVYTGEASSDWFVFQQVGESPDASDTQLTTAVQGASTMREEFSDTGAPVPSNAWADVLTIDPSGAGTTLRVHASADAGGPVEFRVVGKLLAADATYHEVVSPGAFREANVAGDVIVGVGRGVSRYWIKDLPVYSGYKVQARLVIAVVTPATVDVSALLSD